MKTAQEIYDTICRLTYQQGIRSFDPDTGICKYRGPNGTKCAFGQIIPDEKYNPDWDRQSNNLGAVQVIEFYFPEWLPHIDLISALQRAHDNCNDQETFRKDFLRKIKTIAQRFNLIPFTP